MEEPMSPVFDRHLLRRWFHMPAFAVIALAATTAYVADRGLDTWMAWKQPPAPPRLMELSGEATIANIPAKRITWTITLSASAKTDPNALRLLAEREQQVIEQLVTAGIDRRDISATAPETSTTTEYSGGWASRGIVTVTDASQVLEIASPHVAKGADAYAALALDTRDWILVEGLDCSADETDELRHRLQDAAFADLKRVIERARSQMSGRSLRPVAFRPGAVYLEAGNGDPCRDGLQGTATVDMTYEVR
jgi:uncharacterized protein YggE